jgi:hypothetical protein
VDTYDFVGTQEVVNEYTYDLIGTAGPDGSFDVQYGEWTGESVDYHPDFAVIVGEDRIRHSGNRELDTAMVDEILSQAPVRH